MYILFTDITMSICDRVLTKKRANDVRTYDLSTSFDFGLKLLYNKYVCDIFIARKFNSNDRF